MPNTENKDKKPSVKKAEDKKSIFKKASAKKPEEKLSCNIKL